MSRLRKGGAAAAGHQLTADAACEILFEGGTAADAALAAMLAACVAEPVLASPGGGGFAMVARDGRLGLFDFFTQAPRVKKGRGDDGLSSIDADFGTVTQTFHVGGGSVATPGFFPGLFALHERLGRLPLIRIAEPAIRAAREGVRMTAFQARLFEIIAPILTFTKESAALFAPGGQLLTEGALLKNPDLAEVFEAVANEGLRIATEGEVAQAMLDAADGGHLDAFDFAAYRVEERAPVLRHLQTRGGPHAGRRWQLALNPSPAAGGNLVAAIIDAYGDAGNGYDPLCHAKAIDRVDRAWRAAGKPAAFRLDGPTRGPSAVVTRGTTHISVVDGEGMAIALTLSNGEGCGIMAKGCGFMPNNMLGEEDLLPDGPGTWHTDQRLGSMMAPALALSETGDLLALGSGGSNRIRSAMSSVLIRHLLAGESLEAAIEAPRLHVEGGRLDAERPRRPEDEGRLCEAFEDHAIWDDPSMFYGGVHGVERSLSGALSGAGDFRRDGAWRKV